MTYNNGLVVTMEKIEKLQESEQKINIIKGYGTLIHDTLIYIIAKHSKCMIVFNVCFSYKGWCKK